MAGTGFEDAGKLLLFSFPNGGATGEEYREPDLPEGVKADWLVPQGREFGVFEIFGEVPAGGVPVGPELSQVLRAASEYPPALALAREQVLLRKKGFLHRPRFEWEYRILPQFFLDARPQSPFFQTHARVWQSMMDSLLVWIVRRNAEGTQVGWVSSDYFVYLDPIEDFEITPQQLARLPQK